MMSSIVKQNVHVIDADTRSLISTRYKRITKAVNSVFWNISSDTAHSFYVGSYGRGTAIKTSDLDVLIELPEDEYDRFSNGSGNGQSRLLQAVKDAILETYPTTIVKGDGQVVVVKFSDDMKFEILPAFKNASVFGWDGTYKYPNTHMGGNWLSTNPKAEQDAMKGINEKSNGLLYDTCKHIRYIRDTNYSSYELSGILIDTFVSLNIGGWHFRRENEQHTAGNETYEEMLYRKYNEMSLNGIIKPTLRAPGSNSTIDSNKGWDTLGKVLRHMV
ncbi:MAG: nucleotidyltransferase domain-containing protein [Lachnospiraceae bacterium]|nr:nucleotidyltransferase domain-containing protein [Candidatus Colinaster equi]